MKARNLAKAKAMVEKNRHKVGDLVGKATDQVDKVSKGKTSNVTAKIDKAARKFSAGATTADDEPTDAAPVDESEAADPADDTADDTTDDTTA